MNIVIASNREWHRPHAAEIAACTGATVTYLARRDEVTAEHLAQLRPDWVFFPHWSHIIPPEIYEHFRCVIFHMTDLPFGRGGSPLQNLIARGIYETQLSAIVCTAALDAGDVYLKRPLSLHGSAEEIFLRAAALTREMIVEIAETQLTPRPQEGTPVTFRRRTPTEGNISALTKLSEVFDHIRMLDAAGYPPAFLESEHLRLAFTRASLRDGYIEANVVIRVRDEEDGQECTGRRGTSG